MIARSLQRSGSAVAAGLGLWLGLAVATPARAQTQSADPYDPYGAPYRAFAYPIPSTLPGLVPTGRAAEARERRASSIEPAYEKADPGPTVDDELSETHRAGDRAAPYYQAYRRFDRQYRREYVPNANVDRELYRQREARQRALQDAAAEPNRKAQARKYDAIDRQDRQSTGVNVPVPTSRRATSGLDLTPLAPGASASSRAAARAAARANTSRDEKDTGRTANPNNTGARRGDNRGSSGGLLDRGTADRGSTDRGATSRRQTNDEILDRSLRSGAGRSTTIKPEVDANGNPIPPRRDRNRTSDPNAAVRSLAPPRITDQVPTEDSLDDSLLFQRPSPFGTPR
jgi:hypothetical protein